MTKRKKLISSILLLCTVLLIGAGIFVYMTKPAPVPAFRENLDITLTENEFYLSEENFKETMEQEVEPYLERYMTDGFVENGEFKLYYRMFQTGTAEKAIVISHGFTEYADKYNETIYYYLKAGYDVYIMEHRGHGNSTREVEDNSLVYISSFDDYQSDFKQFMDTIVVPNNGSKPLYLFAHSMGGAIAVRFLEDHPEYFSAAVLSAPMMDVNTGSTPEPIANMVAKVSSIFGKSKSYVMGYGPYTAEYDLEGSSTASAARYEYYFSKESENTLHQGASPSYGWLKSAIAETKHVLKKENLAKISVPILLFQAENDSLVEEEGLYKFASGVDMITFKFAEGSKHQVFSAGNETMIPYYNTIFAFLDSIN